ncbi:hypothetical protein L6164_028608 [Bauhinia variegata]|uniref:Uncharacterized protein n=1 Tax=Bauhinia variegata TaxID=167791 RepID=A0ACB9L6R2_BAUVA|nr:hypothetical protein L6164_028608 [Bauhinia variegata]
MVVKVATTCLQWSQLVLPHSPSSSQTLASAISSPSSKRRSRSNGGALVCRFVHQLDRSRFLGGQSNRLYRSRLCENPLSTARSFKRACSASLESFSDEEFVKRIEDLALRSQLSDDRSNGVDSESEDFSDSRDDSGSFSEESSRINFVHDQADNPVPLWSEIRQGPPDWSGGEEIIPANIERKANSVDLPFSLRLIKKKLQWKEEFREAGESAYCSVKKAFSSMVFIIQELHSYTLQMREILFYEDMQGILARVQQEMQASFVWLFQQIFSHTPTLMVYVMILLANFTVYSMGHNAAIAAAAAPPSMAATEIASVSEVQDEKHQKFDSSSIKTFSVSSSSGKTTSIGGNNGGGKAPPVSSGTDGGDRFDRSDRYQTIFPDGASKFSSLGAESVSGQEISEAQEENLWKSIVEEASNMQVLDHDTMERFVSPVSANIESDEYSEYLRTDLLYQTGLSQEPNNPLLLANYAQFLYLVAHEYDRAEEYYKRAIQVEPKDAEAYNKYATFLWKARNDLWAAEETYLEAISAEPSNSFYAANYAHFLWNTGAEDTCFPLDSPENENS